MTSKHLDWKTRAADLWAAIDAHQADDFVAQVDRLAAELPGGSAVGLFERGAARDSTVDVGREREAVAVSLTALSQYLPRYNRSLARYAGEITATRQAR